MKIPLQWLSEFVALPWSPQELGNRLTMAGFELEALNPVAGAFTDVVVGEIVATQKHPRADKLQVCCVNSGDGEPLQIVCGAANARVGLRIALARVGAQLPGAVTIKAASLRGTESQGMLCSAKELGLAEASDGILELPVDAPLGVAVRDYLMLEDTVLELNVTPNRGDAMSMLGIAREVAALSGQPLHADADHAREPGTAATATSRTMTWPVRVLAPAECPRLLTRVLHGLDNQCQSPLWLRERLRRAGLRAISPIVDVTNYVLHELGQPLHAYDSAKLDREIVARLAAPDEFIELLDGRTVALQNDVLVIADASGPVGIAGVMGGLRTCVTPATTDIVLEVAFFSPFALAGRARRVGLSTDASQRFERGVDYVGAQRAMERATALIRDCCGGRAGPVQENLSVEHLPRRAAVALRRAQLTRLLGTSVADDKVVSVLESLQMSVSNTAEGWDVQPPSHRFDIGIEADLIEEVARIVGYQQIPEQDARLKQKFRALAEAVPDEQRIADTLVARGWYQALNFAFVDPALQNALFPAVEALSLTNPMASDLAVMRVSLWSGLLKSVRENLRRQQEQVRLFEFGAVFVGGQEVSKLAGVAAGLRSPEQWGTGREPVDFYDLRADLAALTDAAGTGIHFSVAAEALSCLRPGRSARITRDGKPVGWLGELHPELLRQLDLPYAPQLFELDLEDALRVTTPKYADFSRFPAMRRDLAIMVDEQVTFAAIRERVILAAPSLLKSVRVFDIYRGTGVESGRKSVAIGLIFQDDSRTLTDVECDLQVAKIRADLSATLNAKLRE